MKATVEQVENEENKTMQKKIIKYSIFFIFLSNIIYSQNYKINCNAKYIDDSILLNIDIVNNSNKIIFIQNQFWEIGGNDTSNYIPFYPGKGYICNSINMLPVDSDAIRFRSEKRDFPNLKKISKSIYVNANDTTNINLFFKVKPNLNRKIKFLLRFPIFEDLTLLESNKIETKKKNLIDFSSQEKRNEIICENANDLNYLINIENNIKINDKIIGYLESYCYIY